MSELATELQTPATASPTPRTPFDSTTALHASSKQATADADRPVEEMQIDDDHIAEHEFSLPPTDRGKDAWLFLAACFTLEALVWGFPFAFGVFQNYYSTHEPFAGSSQIAVIGTCAMGIMYLDLPLITGLLRLYPKQGRYAPAFGILLMCVSLALSSFSQNTVHLIVTQGIFYAIGGSISYGPTLLYLDEWFVKRKGLAYGIMWSGTGLGGVTLPLLLEFFLGKYGFRTTLRIWAGVLFAATMPLVYFLKPRLPAGAGAYKSLNLGFVFSKTFMLYQITNIVEALGYFLPGIYLPSYARETLGAGPFPSALTLLVVNIGSVIGCVAMGWLTDRMHVTSCLALSAVGTAIGTFLLWGLGQNLVTLYFFCIIYGFFAGSYTSAWPGIMRQISMLPDRSGGRSFDPTMVCSFLATGRGVGNVVSGPLSEVLVQGSAWKGAMAGYGSGYGTLIVFTGITAVFSGASLVFRRLGFIA